MANKFYDRNSIPTWKYQLNFGVTRLATSPDGIYYVSNEFDPDEFLYNQNKNYQFVTSVTGSAPSILSIKFSAPFKSSVASQTTDINTTSGVSFYTYADPISNELSRNVIKYGAPLSFTSSYITKSTMREIDFLINGYREFRYLDLPVDDATQPNGWCYEADNNNNGSYNWYWSNIPNVISPSYSIFGSGLEDVKVGNDYIATLIDYDFFNLDFNFTTTGGIADDLIEMYLINQSDLKFGKNTWNQLGYQVIHSLTASGAYNNVNLSATNIDGTKKYLVFRPSMSTLSRTTTYVGSLSNIRIVGGYNPLNNLQVVPESDLHVEIVDSVYSFDSVTNGVTYSLSSKIGNGYFKAGIWENGVWNNGWRDDTEVKDFDDVYSSILYAYDISWKIKISGSTYSCNSFKVGDKVAIGNIVAIDINENRKLVRDYYTITKIDKQINNDNSETNWIEVSLDTTFPYRRIEKDSPNHKIKVTKNVWLSGAFFNGYFSGVWNNGLFKGYPKITEMFDTHWIDGFFNGGHFNSNYPEIRFKNIIETAGCKVNNITLLFDDDHGLLPGDYIIIDKDLITFNNVSTLFNASYNGIAKVVGINSSTFSNFSIVVNKKQDQLISAPQPGNIKRYAASGLIQNFKFYDTNRSKLKSNESKISSSIFSFNSWIDTNYDITRSVTLGRDFKSYEQLSGKSISRNNLYGYPTYDVLSSASRFRNSFDLNYGLYKLGTKYKLFTDFIGDSSAFNEPFGPEPQGYSNFYAGGWTFSYKEANIAFNRAEAVISTNNASIVSTSVQDYIDSGVTGNELYLTATNSGGILNNNKVTTKNSRYTVVEFDVVTYSITNSKYTQTNQIPYDVVVDYITLNTPAATFSNSSNNTSVTVTASSIYSLNNDTLLDGSVNFLDGFDGVVYSIDKQADGSIIVAGIFNNYRGISVNRVCKLNGTTGDLDLTFDSNIDPIFTNLPTNQIKVLVVKSGIAYHTNKVDWIYVMVNYASGVTISGNTIKGKIFRVDNNGVEDTTFTNNNYGFNNSLTDIALDVSGDLYVIGQFTQYIQSTSTSYVNRLCILNPNGNLSTIGESATTTSTRFFTNINDIPSTIAIMPDGRIIIGGNITKFAQSANYGHLSTLSYYTLKGILVLKKTTNTSGIPGLVVDASFLGVNAPGSTYPAPSRGFTTTGFNDFINKIKVDSSNRIYVVGNFSEYNDGTPRACFNIVRLKSTGAYDTTFVTGQGLSVLGGYDIELSSSYVYVAGLFTKYNNLDCGKVIKLNITNGSLVSSVGLLDPVSSVVRTIKINNSDLIIGGSFETYKNIIITSSVNQTITTSYCVQSLSILPTDIINLAVEISLDCTPSATSTGSDLGNIIINLKSPAGKVINLKNSNGLNNSPLSLAAQTKLTNTIFDYSSTKLLSTGTSPYSGTFSMEKISSRGTLGFVSDTITSISDLFTSTTNTQGNWTIYIQNDAPSFPQLISWKLITTYKNYINDTAIDITPSVDMPILHLNNLNYEIGTQPTGNGQNIPFYKKMSYLPITQNINHLSVQNTFRFDSVEKTSAERYTGFGTNTIKKKYEYFYNKTDLMMTIQGNGDMGASQSMLVLDNIKMYETDMIPFFKYFEDANIYKGIQVPYEGVAPNIDYLNSDFIFIDNITIGLDSINNTIIDNNVICLPNVITIISASVSVVTNNPSNIGTSSVTISGNVSIQGNVTIQTCGLYFSTLTPPTNSVYAIASTNNLTTTINNLTPNTTYYVQAYAVTIETTTSGQSLGTITTLGEIKTFITVALPPDYSGDYSPTDYSQ